MKYYAWKNTRVNRFMGVIDDGEWYEVNIILYYILKIGNYYVKKSNVKPKSKPIYERFGYSKRVS